MTDRFGSKKLKDPFDASMDATLLQNGFKYYDDWEYGPMSGWSWSCDHPSIRLMKHSFGYSIIFSVHASGLNPHMVIGNSNNADEIIALRDALINCSDWNQPVNSVVRAT